MMHAAEPKASAVIKRGFFDAKPKEKSTVKSNDVSLPVTSIIIRLLP